MLRLPVSSGGEASGADADAIRTAARLLAQGGIVAYPTDTFYGLAADPRSDAAVGRLFSIKGRAAARAIPLIAADRTQAARAAAMTPLATQLADAFWPGPLTVVVPAAAALSSAIHGGSGTVAVRVPAHPVACALAAAFGWAVTSTSANISGAPPASDPDEIVRTMGAAIDALVDVGPLPPARPSTIVDATGRAPTLVRAGAVAWERVLEFLH